MHRRRAESAKELPNQNNERSLRRSGWSLSKLSHSPHSPSYMLYQYNWRALLPQLTYRLARLRLRPQKNPSQSLPNCSSSNSTSSLLLLPSFTCLLPTLIVIRLLLQPGLTDQLSTTQPYQFVVSFSIYPPHTPPAVFQHRQPTNLNYVY